MYFTLSGVGIPWATETTTTCCCHGCRWNTELDRASLVFDTRIAALSNHLIPAVTIISGTASIKQDYLLPYFALLVAR